MNIPQQALDIIKKFEGFSAVTYLDSVDVPTIGYGTTARAGIGIVPLPGMKISERQAEQYLRAAVEKFATKIRMTIHQPMTDNEWSAILSLSYNIGPGAFHGSSVRRYFNRGEKQKAADAFLMWNKAGGEVLRGLTRRRHKERTLFLTPPRRKALWWGFLSNLKGLFRWIIKHVK